MKNIRRAALASAVALSIPVGSAFAAPRPNVPNDPVDIVAALQQTFEEFQAKNDERLQQLETRGSEDVITVEEVDRINNHLTDLQTALEQSTQDLARLTVGGTGEDGADDVENQTRLFMAARTGRPVDEVSPEAVDQYRAYIGQRGAFNTFLRRGGNGGEALPEPIRNALSVGSDTDGGFWVPTEMVSTVVTRLFETSEVRAIANVMTITSDALEMPNDTNEGTSGGWVAEKASRPETGTPGVGTNKIEVHEQYAEPKATQRLLDDAVVDVEGWLARKIADILARTENTAFVTGNGVDKPRGFLDYAANATTAADAARAWGTLQYVITGANGDFPAASGIAGASDPDSLINLVAEMKPAYLSNARWAMNRRVLAAIRKLKDADGRYFIGGLREGAAVFDLLGYPVSTMEDMPALGANAFSIAFGDFNESYQIVDRQGIRTLRDPFTEKPFVKFYTTKRVGGDVINFDALKLLKFGTS